MTYEGRIVLLVGGVGGAKLAYGLYHLHDKLTIIVNTGDDFWHYGLRICPDVDTITYTLSDLVNPKTGWGVRDDSFLTFETLRRFGEEPWFRLGDQDLALHMIRTTMWRDGHSLTTITQHIANQLQINCDILPMSDTPIETMIHTADQNTLSFQEYFVKSRWQPALQSIELRGIVDASLTDAARAAIAQADAVILGPSNPWLSINPILSVPGMRDALLARDIPRIAVTPIVGGDSVKGPTAKIMRELGLAVSPETVVEYYGDILNGFVLDQRDPQADVPHLKTLTRDTLMNNNERRITLARDILAWLADWSTR
jgi:LPPG:FO 2-phospho-L-lactate transferase